MFLWLFKPLKAYFKAFLYKLLICQMSGRPQAKAESIAFAEQTHGCEFLTVDSPH